MEKQFVCISCPMGCPLRVWEENGEVKVEGNTCPRGKAYGIQEFTAPMQQPKVSVVYYFSAPMRTVTSSVPVIHGQQLMCSVKTAQPVPKEKVHQVLEAIYQAQVKAPVAVGDVVLENVAGTGVAVIATRKVDDKRK